MAKSKLNLVRKILHSVFENMPSNASSFVTVVLCQHL